MLKQQDKPLTVDTLINYINVNYPKPAIKQSNLPLYTQMEVPIVYNLDRKNISLYLSILLCVMEIKDNYVEYVEHLNEIILDHIHENYTIYCYDCYKLDKSYLLSSVKKYEYVQELLTVIGDCMHLNIIVIENDSYTVSNFFSQYKKTIILTKTNYEFGYVKYNNETCFDTINCIFVNDMLNTNYKQSISLEGLSIKSVDKIKNSHINDIDKYIKQPPKFSPNEKTLLVSLGMKKLIELSKEAKDAGIKLSKDGKKKNKDQLIEELKDIYQNKNNPDI